MYEKKFVFINPTDANKVAEQLYHCSIALDDNSIVIFHNYDSIAVDTAISLADIPLPLIPGARCPLPFPAHERECRDQNVPRIYVRCLSAYCEGILHGMWIDAAREAFEVFDDIEWMLSYSPARGDEPCEEWAIHGYENFEGLCLSEYESIETVSALARAIEEHGTAFALFQGHYSYNTVDEAIEAFQENFCGVFESIEDFAYQQYEESGMLDQLEKIGFDINYINWDSIANDYELGGYYLFLEVRRDGVYVFTNY